MKKKLVLSIALALVLTLSVVLCACGPNADFIIAMESLEENGYTASQILNLRGIEGVEYIIRGTKKVDDKIETVTVYYFLSAEDADAAWEKLQEIAFSEQSDVHPDWVVAKKGDMIYYGTTNAIKAAR